MIEKNNNIKNENLVYPNLTLTNRFLQNKMGKAPPPLQKIQTIFFSQMSKQGKNLTYKISTFFYPEPQKNFKQIFVLQIL